MNLKDFERNLRKMPPDKLIHIDVVLEVLRAAYTAGAEQMMTDVLALVVQKQGRYIGGSAEAMALADLFEEIKYNLPLPEPPGD